MYRIMVVDDEYYIRDGLCNVVDWASIGAQVVGEAASGVEALAKVPLVQPDVVITDIRMEDMDGLEFAEAVRDAYPDTHFSERLRQLRLCAESGGTQSVWIHSEAGRPGKGAVHRPGCTHRN